ncbi:MAG: IclR family transcriptional regulator [Anaerolineae bacterium]|nr:IclR family transcriptional regulator [Anaerolineae bacterium]
MGPNVPRKPRKTKLVASVVRAARLLKTFSRERPELGITELANLLNLPPSSVYRLVSSLESEGLMEQDPTTGKYRLSLELFLLGAQVLNQVGLGESSLPFLRRLAEESGETVNMGILRNGRVVYLHKVDSPKVIRASFAIGDQAPAHCTAIGKVLLAYLSDREVEELVRQHPLEKWGPNTITSLEALKEELQRTRERGYSLDDEEFAPNIRCIGAPVRDHLGQVVAGIAISGPAHRLSLERLEELREPILETACQISQRMGYRDVLP